MRYDVVTIVAARRGQSQLRDLLSQLPAHFGIPIVCLANSDASLVAELAACTPLQVKVAQPGERMQPGCVYLPPPGSSIVLLEGGHILLSPVDVQSSAQHPVDRFLESAGRVHGNRALAVVLAAYPDDGAEGAYSLKWHGGTVLILDRATIEYYGLAEPMVKTRAYDRILTAGEVANALRATFTGRDLLESAELQFELGVLLDSALTITGTSMGNIQLVDHVRECLHIVVHRGLDRKFLDRFSVVCSDEPLPCARALALRQRVVIEDVFTDAKYAPYYEVAREVGYRAVQSTPIIGEDQVDGVLSTLYPYPHAPSIDEVRNLDDIAAAARSLVINSA